MRSTRVGIGQFTIVDPGTVSQNDIGSNFFLDFESLGKSRAERAYELLGELNEDVKGNWVAKDILSILKENPGYLAQFSTVIATDITRESAEKIAALCWVNGQDGNTKGDHSSPAGKKNTAFLWVKTVGLFGAARIAVPEHTSKSSIFHFGQPKHRGQFRCLNTPFPDAFFFSVTSCRDPSG